jgi:hypothetical protein
MNQEIIEFASKNSIAIDKIYVDKFWNSIDRKHWLYVDDELIDWMAIIIIIVLQKQNI